MHLPRIQRVEVPTRNTEKCFIFLNRKGSQQQSLANNLQAEVIISGLDPYSHVGVRGAGQTEWQDLPPPGTSHLV